MKLPNPKRAVVDIAKLRDYILNPEHPRGRHKARFPAPDQLLRVIIWVEGRGRP
jgi:hypothetical protein